MKQKNDGSIRITGISKGYRFYRRPSDRLREVLLRRELHQTHWALRDVSFAVEPGETFGLLGENGAGKSTMLKIVAGTIRPSQGHAGVHGRVAALLELGAGFHPEESGRENVCLMGAIAGVPARKMEAYYTEVAEFSELPAEALERPVKTYSSGMFMRLGFAAATAVDPDILIVDEALSVGDMHFQKKSLDRIMGFRERGKTVLFCSHNLYQIRSLCSRALWLHEGHVRAIGPTEEVVTAYESHEREKDAQAKGKGTTIPHYRPSGSSLAPVRIVDVGIEVTGGTPCKQIETFTDTTVRVEVECENAEAQWHLGIAIVRNDRENVFGTSTHFIPGQAPLQGSGRRTLELHLPALSLLSGDYWLSVYVLDDTGIQVYDRAESICPFTVHNPGPEFGVVHLPHEWRF